MNETFPNFFKNNNFVDIICENLFILSIILFFAFCCIFAKNITKQSNFLSKNLNSFFILLNHSLPNFNDIIFLLLCLASFFLINLFLVLNAIEVYYNSFVVWIMLLLIFTILILPVYILKNYGSYYLGYLRGSGSKKLFVFELFNDIIGIFSFFIRINIQLIRLLIATVFFAIVVEY